MAQNMAAAAAGSAAAAVAADSVAAAAGSAVSSHPLAADAWSYDGEGDEEQGVAGSAWEGAAEEEQEEF